MASSTTLKRVEVDGINVFYREAGQHNSSTILLLHGFPSSSFQYRNLIPKLASTHHVIAPDLPGFGFTDLKYEYTFDNLAATILAFTKILNLTKFAVYIFDYGAPVGLRLALARPDAITGIISQNGNAFEAGLSPFWDGLRKYWTDPTADNLAPLKGLTQLEGTKFQVRYFLPLASFQSVVDIFREVPVGVLDAEGYAICPDCGLRVRCGTAGLANLEKRHQGTKTCLEQRARRDKAAKQKKNTSILSWMRPKAVPVKSKVMAALSVGGSDSSSVLERVHEDEEVVVLPTLTMPVLRLNESPIIGRLRRLVARIPDTVPFATNNDTLAIFGRDPAVFVDPAIASEEIWEEMMNPTLKRVFGWGTDVDPKSVIRRGPLGMDGFVRFVEYYIDRGVPAELVEGKLEYLIEALETMTEAQPAPEGPSSVERVSEAPTSTAPVTHVTPSHHFIDTPLSLAEVEPVDVDAISETGFGVTKKISELACAGYLLPIPDGKSPHSSYPFGLHDSRSLPWDYSVENSIMTLHSRVCEKTTVERGRSCQACRNLSDNRIVEAIVDRMNEGVPDNANFAYHGFSGLVELLHRKTTQNGYLKFRALNQVRKLRGQAAALSDHKRFAMAIGSGKFERVDRLVSIGLKQRRGIRGILRLYDAAAKGVYKPKNYTEEDDMRGLLLWRLGGNRIAHIAHRALGLPGLTTLRNRSIMPRMIPSPGKPTVQEVQKNVAATFESVLGLLDGQEVVHQVLMLDEIATEKRVRWDFKTNKFLGVCRAHGHNTSLEFTTEDDMEELFRCIDEGEVHTAAEATIGALGVLSNNNRIYPARPVLISGDCKRETGQQHAKLIQTLLDGVNSQLPTTKLRIVSIASDGETRRGSSLAILTFKSKLPVSSKVFPLISPLRLMNQHVGDDDITADKDWKHVIKRFRNLLLRVRGIVIAGVRITPSIIKIHLQSMGHSSQHINSLFNPEDQQDVKLAFDLLKDIWSFPPAREGSTPGFLAARESLRTLGKLLYHMVFPYLCIDLTLSEQVEHLSAAAHLALALYYQSRQQFIPTLLYIDLMIMIKNVIFCIAKAKIDSPDGAFWIILLGTDRLEELFGVLRTMIGNDSNLDILQLSDRITGTIEVLNILAKYPHWDRAPRRLKLPAITRDLLELPDSSDHIKPGSWKGNVYVKYVSLQTSWKRGRLLIEKECPFVIKELEAVETCPSADILSPFGVLLVNIPLDDDDVDESVELPECPSPRVQSANTASDVDDVRVEIEDALGEDEEDEIPEHGSNSLTSSAASTSTSFDRFLLVNGKKILKSRALSMRSRYNKKASSTDRLKRVQEVERYTKRTNPDTEFSTSELGQPSLFGHDPLATLVSCENRLWLCIGEVNGLKIDTQNVSHIPLDVLNESTVSVSYQVLGFRPATSTDDPSLNHDWRSYKFSDKHTFTVPGCLIEAIDPTYVTKELFHSFYLMESGTMVALTSSLLEKFKRSDRSNIPTLQRTKEFPYRERSGDAENSTLELSTSHVCPRCSPEVPFDTKHPQQTLAHVGAHILHDRKPGLSTEPCGLCLRPSALCRFFLTKSKGADGGPKIDTTRSRGCPNMVNFKYAVAANSTATSPCSNVPVSCPLCPVKTSPAVWRYNWKAHFESTHPTVIFADYSSVSDLSNFEKAAMKRVWKDRHKVIVKRVIKKQLPHLEVSAAHSSRLALVGPMEGDDGLEIDAASDEAGADSESESDEFQAQEDAHSAEGDGSGLHASENESRIGAEEPFEDWVLTRELDPNYPALFESTHSASSHPPSADVPSEDSTMPGGASNSMSASPPVNQGQEPLVHPDSPTGRVSVHPAVDEEPPAAASRNILNAAFVPPPVNEAQGTPVAENSRLCRKRKPTAIAGRGECLCGAIAEESMETVKCNRLGCETGVYHLHSVVGSVILARRLERRREQEPLDDDDLTVVGNRNYYI
ncbi:hypothetical protein FPV67DRAFT_1652976 [Lyophyllum atratum]|nr:hypothetical protein FPV67DRAFT_1652976 [Lyophyllum atratum]